MKESKRLKKWLKERNKIIDDYQKMVMKRSAFEGVIPDDWKGRQKFIKYKRIMS